MVQTPKTRMQLIRMLKVHEMATYPPPPPRVPVQQAAADQQIIISVINPCCANYPGTPSPRPKPPSDEQIV